MKGAHEDFVEYREVDPPSDRKFGLTVGAVLLAFGSARLFWRGLDSFTLILLGAGAILLLLGVIVPAKLGPVNRLWMKLGTVLAAILNPLVMLLMFAAIFVPVGAATRLLGRDILQRKPKPQGESYWSDCPPASATPQRLADQF